MTFATDFKSSAPYELVAKFRSLYEITDGDPLDLADLHVFAHWNALFNVWPYWREYVSSTINRAQLPPFIVPVMRVDAPGPVFDSE